MRKLILLIAVGLASCEAPKISNRAKEQPKLARMEQAELPDMDLHQYADRCMCELGGRAGRGGAPLRMPTNISPAIADEIRVKWAGEQISWDGFEFLFDGNLDPPENAVGPITDANDLRCDHAPFVFRNCLPGSLYYEEEVNGILWTALMRREGPSTPGADWGPRHPMYFKTVDVLAFKPDTGAACWFDSLNNAPGGPQDMTNGFLAGPIPRPGGQNTLSANGQRAVAWGDSPTQMRSQPCTTCHGNGPILGSDWIHFGLADGFGAGPTDDRIPYWNAGQLFTDQAFFESAVVAGGGRDRCSTCHHYWMAGSATTPGIETAGVAAGDEMAMRPDDPTYSEFRREPGHSSRTHVMPPPPIQVPEDDDDWDAEFQASLDALRFCAATPFDPGCNGSVYASPPRFWSDPDPEPPEPQQKIEPPDEPINFVVREVPCPAGVPHPPDDPTCQQVTWEDPTDEWAAPTGYRWHMSDPASDSEYCADGESPPPYDTGFPQRIDGSQWRMRYQVTKYVDLCTCIWVRVCGQWCNYPPRIQPVKTNGVRAVIDRTCG